MTCPTPPAVRLDLGDGDDDAYVMDSVAIPVAMFGGPGRDTLTDGPAPTCSTAVPGTTVSSPARATTPCAGVMATTCSRVSTGPTGSKAARGRPARARRVRARESRRRRRRPGNDRVERDYISRFRDTTQPVTITLAGGADDGRPDERDELRSVERLVLSVGGTFTGSEGADEFRLVQVGDDSVMIGGAGDDRLISGDGQDRLDGGSGDDLLDGGFGDDVIVGGPGRDTISGDRVGGDCGPLWCKYPYGNDTILAADGEADSITCGAGTDRVTADALDVVAPDCETVTRTAPTPDAPGPGPGPPGGTPSGEHRPTPGRLVVGPRVRLAVALRRGFTVRALGVPRGRLVLTARRGTRLVARGTVTVSSSGRATVRLRFTPAARRALRRARVAKLAIGGSGMRTAVTLRR